ncbi:Protein dispatched homolog 1 (Protein chameleon) [Durusdinium trenchii]|uniref:Protein dispatched homolog 1 (Protein chameleon) n=1 Tax=Durusdinium trenchii TaxID=1381693 RepID=A0ABP0KRI6_9DINO
MAEIKRMWAPHLSRVEWISRAFVLHSYKLFCAGFLTAFIMTAIAFGLDWFAVEEQTTNDWAIPGTLESQFEDAIAGAKELVDPVSAGTVATRTEASYKGDFMFVYSWVNEGVTEDVLTPKNVQKICEMQRTIVGSERYPLFCLAEIVDGLNSTCLNQPTDIVARFYNESFQAQLDCDLLDLAVVTAIRDDIRSGANPLDNFFVLNNGGLNRVRSQISLGAPLEGYAIVVQSEIGEQYDKYQDFVLGEVEPRMLDFLDLSGWLLASAYNTPGRKPVDVGDGFAISLHSFIVRDEEFFRILNGDQILAAASVIFVGGAIYAHVRSFFVTICGMLCIVLSLPVGLFIYNAILNIYYFNNLHIVVIYLALGLGADDVFVFWDSWKQSRKFWPKVRGVRNTTEALERNVYGTGSAENEVLVARLAYTYRRASGAIFNTSFTTFAAFMATSVSPVIPIRTFGFYAALVVLVNFGFVLTMYPAFVIMDHRFFSRRSGFLWRHRAAVSNESMPAGKPVFADSRTDQFEEYEETWGDKVFSKGFIPLMTAVKVRKCGRDWFLIPWICVVGLLGLFAFNAPLVFELDTPTERDEPYGNRGNPLAVIDVTCTLRNFHDWHNLTFPAETDAVFLGDENATLWTQRLKEFAVATGNVAEIGFIGGELRFFSIKYEASLKTLTPESIKEEVIILLYDFFEQIQASAPEGLASSFQTSFEFLWLKVEQAIPAGLFQGLTISIPVAYGVLLFATKNVILSFYGVLGISLVVAAVLGTVFQLGWTLGIGEAVAGVLVVGLAVDFIIHLCGVYIVAAEHGIEKRRDRWEFAVQHMGSTILAAAFTTAGAACVLFACQVYFFQRMAALLSMLIFFSLFHALFFFSALLLIAGPERNQGDWTIPVRWILARMPCGPCSPNSSSKTRPESGAVVVRTSLEM